MKKSFFILSLMTTAMLAANAWADTCTATNGTCGTNCTYTLDANCHLVVQGPTEEGSTGSIQSGKFVKTPATSVEINGNLTIGSDAFENSPAIQSVVIGNGVTSTGAYAFYGDTNLNSVTISNSVTTIGDSAFYNTSHLTSINIPDTVTSIGPKAFQGANLTSVTIPDSVTTIGWSAFNDNRNLTSITLGNGITSIEESAFYNTSLTSIIIPDSVTTIGRWAFYSRQNPSPFKSIFIPESVTSLGTLPVGYNMTGTVFCPSYDLCHKEGLRDQIQTYTRHADGVYELTNTDGTGTGVYYASPENMSYVNESGILSPIACTSREQCTIDAAAYKNAKATQMAQNGVLCQTKQGCLNLMDMVSNDAYECTTIATCSAAVKNGSITGVNLAAADPVGGGTGGAGSSTGSGKRIYTVEEARQAVEAAGTETVNFRIRYK